MSGGESSSSSMLPAVVLGQSPSERAGVAAKVERLHRLFGCEVLQEAGRGVRKKEGKASGCNNKARNFSDV